MNRDYSTEVLDVESIVYFVGNEVEKTPAFRTRTLFVVGLEESAEVLAMAEKEKVEHIYIGANHSITPANMSASMGYWEDLVRDCLEDESNYLVTVEMGAYCFDVACDRWDEPVMQHENLIPILSVPIKHVTQKNKNTVLKVDDTTFNATNEGVWCHSLSSLLTPPYFTPWSKYTDDTPVE